MINTKKSRTTQQKYKTPKKVKISDINKLKSEIQSLEKQLVRTKNRNKHLEQEIEDIIVSKNDLLRSKEVLLEDIHVIKNKFNYLGILNKKIQQLFRKFRTEL